MFPSKNMFDYINEINRLFPRPMENELQMPNTNTFRNSSFNCTSMTNQSSSSADSISPEVFPHLSPPVIRPSMDNRSFSVKHSLSDTPFPNKRHRAIVGRKILGNTEHVAPFDSPMHFSPVKNIDSEMDVSRTWDSVNQQATPPNNSMFFEPTNIMPNFYELFPMENRGYEYKSPVKTSPSTNSNYSVPMSPSSTLSVSPVSSTATRNFPNRPPLYRRNIVSNFGPSSSVSQEGSFEKICTFCRKNGETPLVFMTHTVKETVGNRSKVTCPILRSHVCSTCGASGDNAHTITYCPILRSSNNGRPLQSTTITLKNTRIKSNGRKRY